MQRAVLFALVGALFVAAYERSDPGSDGSAAPVDWTLVLLFSAALAMLAGALVVFARMALGQSGTRASYIAAGGSALSSVANVVEDGFLVDAAFFAFIAGAAILNVGLLALAGVVAWRGRGPRRAYAVVPVLTLAAITFYMFGGGYLMSAAWLIAAGLAIAEHRRVETQASPGRYS
jgi:hypothetical protein